MSAASEAQRAQMARDVAELKAQYTRGLVAQGLAAAFNVDVFLSPLTSLFSGGSDSTRRVVQGMEQVRRDINTWETRWKKWAEAGRRDDGSSYTVERWQEVGRSIAKDVTFWTGEAVSRTAFVAVAQAVEDTGTTLVEWKDAVAEALPSPPTARDLQKLKLVGGLVLAAVVLGTGGYFIRSVTR